MATLQKIRNKAGILISVIIGLALLAFILGDALNYGPSIFSKNKYVAAEIDGEVLDVPKYAEIVENRKEFYRNFYNISSFDQERLEYINDEVWNNTVREIIMGKSYDDLGINVSIEELKTMILGDSIFAGGANMVFDEPHPIIKQYFTNPETGELDRVQMINYLNTILNPQYVKEYEQAAIVWKFLEDQIVDDRMSQKYFTLVSKGLSPNSLDAKYFALENESTVSFDYTYLSYNTIADEDISISDDDISAYYENHKKEYLQEESRSIEYVVFPIEPSELDEQNAKEFVTQSKLPFARTDDPVSFVNNNSDLTFRDINYGPSDIPAEYQDSIFNGEPGYVAGPYLDNNSYKIARVMEFTMVPDSVRARHILISLSFIRDNDRAEEVADSIKGLIDNGRDFAELAGELSFDNTTSPIGGDLGWFRETDRQKTITEFCFNNNKGDVGVVRTNEGYHILKIEDQSRRVRKAKLAIVQKDISPSDETMADIYYSAVQFGAAATDIDKFRELSKEQNLTPKFALDFHKDTKNLPGMDYSREVIRWSFENEKNSVSEKVIDLGDKYIIAAITDAKEKGFAPLEDMKAEIEIAVSRNKKLEKLAENMKSEMGSAQEIDEIANTLDTEVRTAENVRFSNPYVSMVGLEPAVVSNAFETEAGQITGPVIGENGVFVIQVNDINIPEDVQNAAANFKINLRSYYESRVNYQGYEALIQAADIKDNRVLFF